MDFLNFFTVNLFSLVCIIYLKHLFKLKFKNFIYFKVLILILIFLFILTLLGLIKYLIYFKFFIFFLFVLSLVKKKISFETSDKILLFYSIFLIYLSYNSYFGGTDVFTYFGYLSKYFYLNENFPSTSTDLLISYQYSIPQVLFNYLFLSGLDTFSEETCIFAMNVFVLMNFITIIDSTNKKRGLNIMLMLLANLFFLRNIFGDGGVSIMVDELSILLIFSVIIFILNISKIDYRNLFFIFFASLFAVINKPTIVFMLFAVFGVMFVKFFKNKYDLLKIFALLIILFQSFSLINKYQSFNLTNNDLTKAIAKMNAKEPNNIKKQITIIRSNKFIESNKVIFSNKENFDQSKRVFWDMMNTETYKASLFPPLKYLFNTVLEKNISYFQLLSFKLWIWILIFSCLFLLSIIFKKKIKIDVKIFLILIFTFLINIYASFINEIRKNTHYEKKNEKEIIISIEYTKPYSDYSRYNGWSIYLLLLFLNYYLYKYDKNKFLFIFIFLCSITPMRAYGNIINYKTVTKNDVQIYKKNMRGTLNLNDVKTNNCLESNSLIVLDFNDKNLTKNRNLRNLKYIYYDKKIEIVPVGRLIFALNGYENIKNFNFKILKDKANINCLITLDNSKTDKEFTELFNKKAYRGSYNIFEFENYKN